MRLCLTRILLAILVFFPIFAGDETGHADTLNTPLPTGDIRLADGRVAHLQGVAFAINGDNRHAKAADRFLNQLTGSKTVTVEAATLDRYGRISGAVFASEPGGSDAPNKIWLQGALLDAGLAFVYPPTGDELYLEDMLAREKVAREARRGLWADPAYADTPANAVDGKYGQFAFVSGLVVKAERIKNKVYLNFGADWHNDFTIAIAAHDLRAFRNLDIDPLTYQGKRLRVRGWVKREFGPMITVTHPSQIEVLP